MTRQLKELTFALALVVLSAGATDFEKIAPAIADRQDFQSPNKGEMLDWVLVLDDVAKNYPASGTRQ